MQPATYSFYGFVSYRFIIQLYENNFNYFTKNLQKTFLVKIIEYYNIFLIFLCTISSVIFIIIAALFLIFDFDTIDHVVKDKLPKKYEWQAAFGLAFTVIRLYLKVLDIIITIAGRNKN